MARKIAVAIQKGGVGKTTTSKNLAASLGQQGNRVLLVDLDQQANATRGVGFDPSNAGATLNDLFEDPTRDANGSIYETPYGFHLLPAHPNLAKTETGMAYKRASEPDGADPRWHLKGLLGPLEDAYDFIILDTPPSLGYLTINALAAADELLIPAAASAYTEDGLAKILEAYEKARSSYNPNLHLFGILITRLKQTNASLGVLKDLQDVYVDRLLPQAIVEATAVDEAEQMSQPVVVWRPDSPAAVGYHRLAEMLANGR
ncbi:ATPase involved in chromosome partitioning [Frankia sp. CcI6]|uniref:ParA family protein n=1 Tax=unclassified Frankia TaxID=2632575 RepID=UPI0003D03393|nr:MULTISPECIES: AAA family ATPase [unclassified Frankia]ETA01704.1 ATPase involved in chromosome partitioning [Frankia sp. CcI6]KFB03854.1 ATPase involved in chromosome partitioning [Frankia sp. Allo2]OHV48514.1 hypothetical protein CgIS1_05755 [Frankia sp. CgIS1]